MSGLSRFGSIPWLPKSARSTDGVPREKPCGACRRAACCRSGTRWWRAGRGCPARRRSGGTSPKPPRSTVLLLSSSRQAKPTRGLKLFLSVLISVSGRPDLVGRQGAAERDQAGRQQRRDLRVRHDVMAAVDRAEVRESQALLVPRADDLVAQAEEHRQALVDLPVVLREDREVVRVAVERPAVGDVVAARRRAARAGNR